ncbi:hypothetical protein C1645_836775 [Glomus cerebriforme]|uniref:Uncharacterized protein n=1 Tax=Glomus cerebriforme TaxID=658196 RepID=A0A397S5B4_9GLOM|nr:hypothetical protein C1645_836775 [Glomus cerebriforme]
MGTALQSEMERENGSLSSSIQNGKRNIFPSSSVQNGKENGSLSSSVQNEKENGSLSSSVQNGKGNGSPSSSVQNGKEKCSLCFQFNTEIENEIFSNSSFSFLFLDFVSGMKVSSQNLSDAFT